MSFTPMGNIYTYSGPTISYLGRGYAAPVMAPVGAQPSASAPSVKVTGQATPAQARLDPHGYFERMRAVTHTLPAPTDATVLRPEPQTSPWVIIGSVAAVLGAAGAAVYIYRRRSKH